MFVLKNASVRRNGNLIVNNVSLNIKQGEHIAIIGPNGAGKSTLLQILTKQTHPLATDDFSYSFCGNDRIPLLELRSHLGIVSPSLLEACNTTYTALEVVISGLFSSYGLDFHHVVTKEHEQRALEEMAQIGITDLKDKYMNSLSSGEAEKVILARAAVHNPEVLILDEVSNTLDFPTRASLRKIISHYATTGKTVIMVTHELSEIPPECDRVIIMKKGQIVEDGDKHEVLTEKTLSRVYETPVFVQERENIFNAWC